MYNSNKVASITINECSVQKHTAEFCRASFRLAKSPPLSKMLTTATSLTLLSIPVALADLHHVCCLRVSVLTFLSRPSVRAILAPLAQMPPLSPARPVRPQKGLAPATLGDKRRDMWPWFSGLGCQIHVRMPEKNPRTSTPNSYCNRGSTHGLVYGTGPPLPNFQDCVLQGFDHSKLRKLARVGQKKSAGTTSSFRERSEPEKRSGNRSRNNGPWSCHQ